MECMTPAPVYSTRMYDAVRSSCVVAVKFARKLLGGSANNNSKNKNEKPKPRKKAGRTEGHGSDIG